MKRLSFLLLLLFVVAVSCKDEEMFGTVTVTVHVAQAAPAGTLVGLFDFNSNMNDNDALYTVAAINEHAQFDEVNPGNYRVAVLSAGGNMFKGVQVKAGKTATVTLN
jgi:hypothetical protein